MNSSILLLMVITLLSPTAMAKETKAFSKDLNLAHKGTAEIDTAFLNRAPQPATVQEFFSVARKVFRDNPKARFADRPEVRQSAEKLGITHLGGPMLGALSDDGARVWLRTLKPAQVTVLVQTSDGERSFGPTASTPDSDLTAVVTVSGLKSGMSYAYRVLIDGKPIPMPADARITPASNSTDPTRTKIAFGADFHKSGLWNRPLLERIRKRGNAAMLLIGDSAVDDRDADVGLPRSDYLLRDLSPAWRELVASVPVYATWDVHDYFYNDKSGVPPGATEANRAACGRYVSNPGTIHPAVLRIRGRGIFFRTRIGPCDLIMLDTRFFRTSEGKSDAFLGKGQMNWLVDQLAACTGPFIILSSGTMWSDDISNGKDSWGKWDPEGRERLLDLIEQRRIGRVILLAGDQHRARVLRIPRPSGFVFHEFELGSLGAHPGPAAMWGTQCGERNGDAMGTLNFPRWFARPTTKCCVPRPNYSFYMDPLGYKHER